MKWVKQALLWLLGLFFLLLIVITLLGFTHTGNRWLWDQARSALPALKGELVAGQLGRGWIIEGAGWQDELVDVSVARAELDWDLGQLLKGRLWVRRLEVAAPQIRIHEGQSEPVVDETPFVWRPLPVRIQIDALHVTDLALTLPGLELALKEGSLGARLTRHGLTVDAPHFKGLDLALTDSAPATPPKSASPEPLVLPEVRAPFPILLKGLQLEEGRYRDGDIKERLAKFNLTASWVEDLLKIDALYLEHEQGRVDLTGRLTLSGAYPLALTLDGTLGKALLEGDLKGQQLHLVLGGSLHKLEVALQAKGPVQAALKGKIAPLAADLPFDAKLTWPALRWPLHKAGKAEPSYRLKKGALSAKGSLKKYQVTLDSAGEGTDLPPFTLAFKGEGDLSRLQSLSLKLAALGGSLDADGKLDWSKGILWEGKTRFANLEPQALVPELKGVLSGQIESQFHYDEQGRWSLKVPALQVRGQLDQYPLALEGNLSGDDQMRWSIPALRLETGPNRLNVTGSLTPASWQLDGLLAAPKLAGIYPGLKGDLAGSVQIRGSQQRPALALKLAGKQLYYAGLDLRDLMLEGSGILGDRPSGEWVASAKRLSQEGVSLRGLEARLAGSVDNHTLTLAFRGQPVGAKLAVQGALAGTRWRGRLEQMDLTTPLDQWGLRRPWPVTLDTQSLEAEIGDLCLDSQGAAICLQGGRLSPTQGALELAISGFDLTRLRPWLPDNFQWQAQLLANAKASWRGNQSQIQARISTPAGVFITDQVKTPYQRLSLGLDLDSRTAAVDLNFTSQSLGALSSQLQIRDPKGAGQLSGAITFTDLKPDAFAPLLPEVRELKGILSGRARVEGTTKRPLLYGDIRLRDGAVQTHSDMVTLTGLDTRLHIDGERADIDGKVMVGKGPLNLGGSLSWASQPVSGHLSLRGEGLEAQYPGMGRVRLSPDLAITLGERNRISGQIDIPWARILVNSLPESAVAISSDVVVVRDDKPEAAAPVSLPLEIQVAVNIGPDVQLNAMGLRTKLDGRLRLSQDAGRPMAGRGEIQLRDGRFKAYGQNLLIKKGTIRFSGPLDQPYLNVNAIRNPETVEDNVTVGVKVTGLATKPKLTVYSEPAMSESERLSYLLRGKGLQTSGEDGGFNGLLVAGAVGQASGVVSNIGETLGLRDVSLDTAGSGDETQVTLSAYLLPGLQLQYGVGVFSPIAEFKLRYELMPRLYLQVVSGLAQAVDIFYRFEI